MEFKHIGDNFIINNEKIGTDLTEFLKKLPRKTNLFWVIDDYTFYNLILFFKKKKYDIKINVYDFNIVGISYKNLVFKQNKLKSIENKLNLENKFNFSYGSYAFNIFTTLVETKLIEKTLIPNNTKIKIRKEYISEPLKNELLFSVDFNLMYYNCLSTNFVFGKIFLANPVSISKPGFYYIKYESKDFKFPILFYKNELNSQNYFCNGVGEGLFWYEEILLFEREGGIIRKIFYAYLGENYGQNFIAFTNFIAKYEDTKLIKNLANNLYGKLAMKDFFYSYRILTETEFTADLNANRLVKWKKWYDYYVCENIEYTKYTKYTDVCAAAAITAKARIKLYELTKELNSNASICLLNTDEVIYSSKHMIDINEKFNVKTKRIDFDEFNVKKLMFLHKRKHIENDSTAPYKLSNGMLL
jgi:hypothetical protein